MSNDSPVFDRVAKIAGLRKLADFLDANPDVEVPTVATVFPGTGPGIVQWLDGIEDLDACSRPSGTGDGVYVTRDFGGLTVEGYLSTEDVCEVTTRRLSIDEIRAKHTAADEMAAAS